MAARSWVRAALLLAGALLASCAATMELPKDFLRLKDGGDFRAVTSDDARVWIREFDDENEGPLAFWAETLEHEFTQQRGYELVGKGDAQNAENRPGRWFECTANVRGDRVGYLVAIWVDGETITVLEFAARTEVFAARVESVRTALRTVRP
jgi:hypothetical protein